ncbi:MAG: D-inositol-3-phosphate glycosyltransferase [Acidimicrobiales bacterium]|nr:MAG: glycosyltransferase family 1 protein [Actinomycetota bacterium]MBV6507134.1 D-inositol-3-phosphate glycosyltransferase [Acidimicrobiales bacterium]RIK05568.1 MAG: hypothetical protein DCC48_09785 [Acidobacteriota bacterium]
MCPEGATVRQLLGPSAGGIRGHVAVLAETLEQHGWTAPVAGPPGVMAEVGSLAEQVRIPPGTSPLGVWRARRDLAALAPVDLVHAHGLKAGWIASSLRSRPPLVVTIHNLVLDEAAGRGAGVLRRLEERLPRRADRLIAVSQQIAERFAGLPGADRIVVIPPASRPPEPRRSPAEVKAALGVDADRPLIVVVARLHAQKDHETFLRALSIVGAKHPEAVAAIIGEGPLEDELKTRARELGVAERTIFAGPSPYAVDELNAADVVALSSRWEGSPLVVAEALQLAKPVVSTAVGAIPEVVTDGVTGRLCPVDDPDCMARCIIEVLDDPQGARSLGRAGREKARSRFGTERLVREVEAVYCEVLG